jgi:hypothetical protein
MNQFNDTLGFNSVAYEFDYFSGSQIGLYIGDILVDDAMYLQYGASQTKRPVYGYASQYWHTVADGQVMVQGSFMINFKEADYLIATLERYRDNIPPIDHLPGLVGVPNKEKYPSQYVIKRESIERMMERESRGDESTTNPYELYTELAALPDQAFEDAAENFEDLIWKEPGNDFLTPNIQPGIYRKLGANTDTYRRADQYKSFDIHILYGDISNKAANHTIKKLINVDIIGEGQTLKVDAEPIAEVYNFIAQNVA